MSMEKQISNNGLITQKVKARHLIVEKGFTQKETAAILGISEKTMSHWARGNNWAKQKERKANSGIGMKIFFEDFHTYVKKVAPELPKQLDELWLRYLQQSTSVAESNNVNLPPLN